MEYKNLIYATQNRVAILTISRPKALNALNSETISEIRSALQEARRSEARVLIVTGAGEKAFVAGADIREIESIGLEDGFDFVQQGHQMNREIECLGIPTIAAVNGLALGGGCELAMACTLRIVSEKAKFGLPELGLGIIPGYGGTQRLARLIGRGRALWHMLTGDWIDAPTAVATGLASLMVKPEALIEEAVGVAEKIATKAPLAVKMAMAAVKYGVDADLETGLALESALANITVASADKSEGIKAFTEKRSPVFKGM